MRYVACRPSSQPRVSIVSGSPASSAAAWRSISYAIARSTDRNEFMFLTSTRVPKASSPRSRSETFASTRIWPRSMSASLAPIARISSWKLLRVASGLLGGADLRLGHDLHQRRAGPVEVDQRGPAAVGAGGVAVDELGGVLLEVRPRDVHDERSGRGLDRQAAVRREGDRVLADLVALRQVGIEVVLALPLRALGDVPLDRQAGGDHELHRAPVDHRQRPGRPRHTGHTCVLGAAPS